MDADVFADLVAGVVESLPERFFQALENLEIAVEEWPDRETLRLARLRSRYELLGFYHGIPLTERTSSYNLIAPDTISIYQKPIEAQCRTEDEVREMVRRVVLHEIGAY